MDKLVFCPEHLERSAKEGVGKENQEFGFRYDVLDTHPYMLSRHWLYEFGVHMAKWLLAGLVT